MSLDNKEIWLVYQKDLKELIELDREIQKKGPINEQTVAVDLALSLYFRYYNILQRLIACYDQMIQPQKREFIKKMLDCVIGRMLEYKHEIVNLECEDYQWPENWMHRMKFTPDDFDAYPPASQKEDRKKYLDELFENVEKALETVEEKEIIETQEIEKEEFVTTTRMGRRRRMKSSMVEEQDEAKLQIQQALAEQRAAEGARIAALKAFADQILLIQKHERARIGRSVGIQATKKYMNKEKADLGLRESKKYDERTKEMAAMKIQNTWRKFVHRKALKKKYQHVEEVLDMTIPSWHDSTEFDKDNENVRTKVELIRIAGEHLKQVEEEERTRLLKTRGPGLKEDITEELREWFMTWYNKVGHFDTFPEEKLGGSVLIARGETLTPEEYVLQQSNKGKNKKEGNTKKGSEENKDEKKKKQNEEKLGWQMPDGSLAFSGLEAVNEEFIRDWSWRDESPSSGKSEYLDLINDKLCYELQLEMRRIVDELMRLELERWNRALDKDLGKKSKGKKKKKKKSKGKKKSKKESPSTEDFLNELVKEGIIRKYPTTSLKDWIGDLSYQNYEARQESRDYKHRLGDIKQIIMEYCVLPMISKRTHQVAPLIKSVCICGLPQTGKTFLVNAICSEIGALLFDMTPELLIDKYKGKKNQRKLIDMISIVSRAHSPSIVYIDGGEKPWWKKIPKDEKHTQPRRFASYFKKFVKRIKPGDQLLFLTTATEPYNSKKAFLKIHNKFIIIPRTDYNTLYMYYKDLLMKYHNVDRNLNVSALAEMSIGIPLVHIRESIEKVLSLRRRMNLYHQPLREEEIWEEVSTYRPPPIKTLKKYENFHQKTPLAKRKAKMMAAR